MKAILISIKPLEALENLKNLSNDVQYASKIPCIDNELKTIENALIEHQELLKIEYRQNTINDFYPNTKKMIDDLLDLLCTKLCDFLKDGKTYTRASVLEDLGFAIRYVKTFAYGGEFNETEKIGVSAKKLKALDIIKKKGVSVFVFQTSGDLETYNSVVISEGRKLTQEEYDLLKGVLL